MESATEMHNLGHSHIDTELSMSFVRAMAGETFTKSSRRRIQTVEELPELFIPDSAPSSSS